MFITCKDERLLYATPEIDCYNFENIKLTCEANTVAVTTSENCHWGSISRLPLLRHNALPEFTTLFHNNVTFFDTKLYWMLRNSLGVMNRICCYFGFIPFCGALFHSLVFTRFCGVMGLRNYHLDLVKSTFFLFAELLYVLQTVCSYVRESWAR